MSKVIHVDTVRHKELFDASKFSTPITVIGVGATGSWLVLALAKLGITDITVYDFDKIEDHNVANQLFGLQEVGMFKVDALHDRVLRDTMVEIKVKNEAFTNQRVAGIVFVMTDTMASRKEIFTSSVKMNPAVQLMIEPRMGLDMGRVFTIYPTDLTQIARYEESLYSDEEAEVSACGSSMTVVTSALGVVSTCVRQLINHCNGTELYNEIMNDYKFINTFSSKF